MSGSMPVSIGRRWQSSQGPARSTESSKCTTIRSIVKWGCYSTTDATGIVDRVRHSIPISAVQVSSL